MSELLKTHAPDVLSVMSWNVRDMLGDPRAVRRVLTGAHADVVCLQEAPRLFSTRQQLVLLARDCGLYFVAGGRASAGTAMLVSLRTDVDGAAARRLPVHGWRTRPRGALVGLPGTERVSVTCLHLGLDEQERADHVDRLLAGLVDDVPAVIAGDLNERPDGASWRTLSNWAVDPNPHAPKTFRSTGPRHRIDAVLVDPRVEVVDYGDPPGVVDDDVRRASDHRPVLAQIRLRAVR
jgi:endonuclease/exonuclease/phosphatase family metal-dependent hydrolase